jgi:uncharacterized repeat protein (TIGR01451 family)/pilin isopeptide linkage protein/uncharacterized repeat protein (TIGR02543 family)
MYKQLRKITAIALAAIMLFSILPLNVLAALITTDYSGGVSLRSIIPSDPPVATRTYEFKVDGVAVDTQIIKNGEYLTEPQAPEKTDHRFVGWFVGEEQLLFGPSNPISFTEPPAAPIEATARFEQVYYVFFMSSKWATAFVYKTKTGITGEQISTDDVVLPLDSTQAVTGWYTEQNLSGTPVGANFTIGNANQKLWPKIETGNYLYFVSGDQANYVVPQFIAPNGVTQVPNVTMTRPGYTFSHWSLSKDGPAYTFGQKITSDVTLYAVWTANPVNYTVIFWKQSINDSKNAADSQKNYDYSGTSVTRQAIAGSTVSPSGTDKTMDYTGFHYNAAKSVPVVVRGDGTTTLNVYYDRNLLTMIFQTGPSKWSANYATIATYTGLYGQSLAQNGYSFISGRDWQEYLNGSYHMKVTFLDAFIYDNQAAASVNHPNDTLTLRSWSTETGWHTIMHYKQKLDGTYNYPSAPDNTNWSIYDWFTFTNKYVGFTVAWWYSGVYPDWRQAVIDQSTWYGANRNLHILHTRNSYALSFRNGGNVIRTENVLFEQPLAAFAGYVPPRPSGMPEGSTFEGWYKDENHTHPIDLATEKMGPNSLMLYAKWELPVVHATVYQTMSGGTSVTHTLPYNEPINQGIMSTVKDSWGHVVSSGDPDTVITMPANHKWIGWTTKSGNTYTTFNFATNLVNDIELYPYYVSIQDYSVTYKPGTGTGTVTDSKTYFHGAYADVQPGTITPPAGQVFLGWTLSGDTSGKIYVANDKIFMDGNKVLTATFGPKLQATITYKPNGGVGDDVVYNLQNNQSHTIIANPGYTREGYQFIGWNTAPMGVGQWYSPGVNVLVDGQDNILYAQWEPLITIFAQKGWNFLPPGSERPDIWFTLYRKDANDNVTAIGTKKVESATIYWENQLHTNGSGFEYIYYVKETDAFGADYVPPSFEKQENGLVVINTYRFVDFTVTKVWAGDHLPAIKPTITVQLQVSVDGGDFVNHGVPVSLPDGTLSYTWLDLPLEDSQRRSLSYRAIESVKPDSYVVTYNHGATGTTITNTYQTTNYKAIKKWSDPNNLKPAGENWPAIQLQLYQDGSAYGDYVQVPKQAESSFEHTWTKLPALKSDGTPHVYTARELVVPPRYRMTADDSVAGQTTITNTLSRDSLTGSKHWDGEAPSAGASVQLQLYQTKKGVDPSVYRKPWGSPVTVTAADNWQHTWTGMPAVDNPANPTVEYEYEIEEVAAPAGYYYDTLSSASLYVTNVSQTTSFTALKAWEDGINSRPEKVTLYLERSSDNGTTWERVTAANNPGYADYDLTAADNNQHTWTGLTRFHTWDENVAANRVAYQYRVREEAVANYITTYPDNNTVHNKYDIPLRTITITKKWIGGKSSDHVEPALHLWRRFTDNSVAPVGSGEYTRNVEVTEDTASPINNKTYTYTYSGLPDTDADGNKYLYGFTEDEVLGYQTTFKNPYLLNGIWYALPGSVIENAYQVPMTVNLAATKQWVDGPESDHKRVKLSIFRTIDDINTPPAGGITMEEAEWFQANVTPMEGTAETITGFWPNLAQTDINGNPYTYFFIEDTVPTNYTREYSQYITVNGVEYAYNGATVTNTYTSPDITVSAAKIWENGPEADHTEVPLRLYRKIAGGTLGVVTGITPVVSPATGTANRFDYTWMVPQTDPVGNPYTYYFSEDEQANYTRTYSASETIDGILCAPVGATVTNSYASPKTSVTATKTWVNGAQASHVAVPLTLYRKTENSVLTEVTGAAYTVTPSTGTADEFTYTWADLDETDIDGKAYTYCFKEDEVEGYTREYASPYETDYGLAGTSVSNTYIQPTGTVEGAKHWVHINPDVAVPTVYMKLYRSTNPGATTAELEAVPGAELKMIGANTPKTQEQFNQAMYTSTFEWTGVPLNAPDAALYFFFVKEVDANGNPYVPEHFEKHEFGRHVYNVYSVTPASLTPQVTKKLAGRPLKAGEFTFELVEMYGPIELATVDTATNDASGNVIFDTLEFGSNYAGTEMEYIIREVVPDTPEIGMFYDPLEVALNITFDSITAYNGVLGMTPAYSNDTEFNNSYTATGSLSARTWATKELQGRALQAGEFSYQLKRQGSAEVLQTKTNAADGSISFDALSFTQADIGKTYTYTVNEVMPASGESGMAYDATTLRYRVTVEDAGNGQLTVSWVPEQDPSKFTNIFTPNPQAEVTKTASPKVFSAPGTVTYTYMVKNTGNVPLTGVTVEDDKLGTVMLDKANLAIGETATGTATFEVKQSHIDVGTAITNIATVTVNEAGFPETKTSETITFTQSPSVQVTKVANPEKLTAPGPVVYTYTVKNDGNVTLTGVKVHDDKKESASPPDDGYVTLNATTLAPGESATGTWTYNVTQADIDAGADIVNKATVTATVDQSTVVLAETSKTITFKQTPSARITKVADETVWINPGTVTYTYTVKNTGNVTLTDLKVQDDKVPQPGYVTLNAMTLAPDEETTGTWSYNVTQADINASVPITNIATVSAAQTIPLTQAKETIRFKNTTSVEFIKYADKKEFSAPGTVTYTYTVRNTGNVTLTGVSLSDNKITTVNLGTGVTELAPKQMVTITATYDVTQDDIDAGAAITNIATFKCNELADQTATETITFTQNPSAQVTKVASPEKLTAPGPVIYTYTVKNDGNVTLTGVKVHDDKKESASPPDDGYVTLNATTLAPGESATGTWTYNVTQADIDAGADIVNKATVTATVDQSTVVLAETSKSITFKQTSKLVLSKKASRATYQAVNDVIEYTVELVNDGNVSILNTYITDAMPNLTIESYTHVPKVGDNTPVTYGNTVNLKPGDKLVLKASYTVTQDDLDGGSVTNAASGGGYLPDQTNPMQPSGTQVSPTGSGTVTVNAVKNPLVSVTKIADPDENIAAAGTVVTYTYTVKNTGNVTLTGLKVHDNKKESASPPDDGYVTLSPTTLAPGAEATGTWTYTVTQDDIDLGTAIKNIATVTADASLNLPETKTSEEIWFKQTPSATIVKTANKDEMTAPGTVIYTYEVTNTGNVTLNNVVVTDDKIPLPGTVDLKQGQTTVTALKPGESATGTWIYDVSQEDIDKGADITNTATLTADEISDLTDDWTVKIVRNPELSISKQWLINNDPLQDKFDTVDDELAYMVTLENKGNVTIYNAEITDNMPGLDNFTYTHIAVGGDETGATSGAATLKPGEKLVMKADYKVTQDDLDAGKVSNTAYGSGDMPDSADPTRPDTDYPVYPQAPGKVDVSAAQSPSAEVTKEAAPKAITEPGTVTYTYTVENTGNVTLTGVKVEDDKLGTVAEKVTIPVGQSKTFTKQYKVTQEDIDTKTSIQNVVTVTATQPIPETKTDETITFTQTPNASIEKKADVTEWTKPGLVTYTYEVTNTGNVTLTNVKVEDNLLGPVPLLKTTLAVGESTTGKLTYKVTQTDIDAGTDIVNEATVSADQNLSAVLPATETITFKRTPLAKVTKSADRKIFTQPGKVTYTYSVINTGNVTLTGVKLTDNLLGSVPLNRTTLNLGEVAVGQLTYTVTQADIDRGTPIVNEVTVTANENIPTTSTDETIRITQLPGMNVGKRRVSINGDPNATKLTAAGDKIAYEIVVKNTGFVTLTNVQVTDSLVTLTPSMLTESFNSNNELNAGETWTYAYTYTVTQADIDKGGVTNTANASGEAPNPEDPTNPKPVVPDEPGTVEVPADQTPGMTVEKRLVSVNDDLSLTEFSQSGDVLAYKVVVKNTGNVTLLNVQVTDSLVTLTDAMRKESKTVDGKLEVGETWTYEYTYTVSQTDIDTGKVGNSASVSGRVPDPANPEQPDLNKPPVTPDAPSAEEVTAVQTPGMTVEKRLVSVNDDSSLTEFSQSGDVLAYKVVVKNTGNVTLLNVQVTDSLVTLTDAMRKESKTADGKLEVGETWTYEYTYTVSQADIDKGKVGNSASASGRVPDPANPEQPDPSKPPVTPDAPSAEEVTAVQTPGMTVEKRLVSVNDDSSLTEFSQSGDVLAYKVVVKNTGNVTLLNVQVTDSLVTLTDAMRKESKTADGKLEVGETWTYEYTYTVSQADIDTGKVGNSASVSGRVPDPANPEQPDPNKPPVTPDAPGTEEVTVVQTPGMTVIKTADKLEFAAVGEKITYTVVVKNTGNVILEDVVITDSLVELTDAMRKESKTKDGKLEVGETWTYTYVHVTTQDDMDRGVVKNAVKATSPQLPNDPVIPLPSDETTVSGKRTPGMTIVKNVDKSKFAAAGEELTYTIVVTNTGNVTLEDVVVTDSLVTLTADMLTESATADGKLEVGETWTYEYTYAVTQADMDAGYVKNAVHVASPDFPDDDLDNLLPVDEVEVHKRTYTVVKTATEDRFYKAGDVLNYTVTVTNTGMAAVEGLKIADTLVPFAEMTLVESVEDNGNLDVGEVWTLTYEYTVTEADATAGTVLNTVMATDPSNPADPEVGVNEVHKPSYAVKMTVAQNKFTKDGDGLYYTVTITNTGKVALDGLIITDALVPFERMTLVESVESNGSLDVGEVWTLRYGYTVTEADATAGKVLSAVTVTDPLDQEHPVRDEVMVEKETMLPISGVASVNVSDCYE